MTGHHLSDEHVAPPDAASQRGATSIEYVLIAALVSIGIIAGVTAFATAASDLWFMVASTATSAM